MKQDPSQPQRVGIRYSISNTEITHSIAYAEREAVKRMIEQLSVILARDCITKVEGTFLTEFSLNAYVVTPEALEKLVQERVQKVKTGYPIVDFY